MKIFKALRKAMREVGEDDDAQGFWEIRLYARRNSLLHSSGILDRRLRGQYQEVLSEIQSDLTNLDRILPEEEKNSIEKYERMMTRFLNRWFKISRVDGKGQVTWDLNEEAKTHVAQLQKLKTAHQPPETEEEKTYESIAALTQELMLLRDMLSHNTHLIDKPREVALASLQMAAEAVPKAKYPTEERC